MLYLFAHLVTFILYILYYLIRGIHLTDRLNQLFRLFLDLFVRLAHTDLTPALVFATH